MPIYEYRCKECHQVFEEWTRLVDDEGTQSCPVCDSVSERIISNTTFVLKGGGWYSTEYGHKAGEPKPSQADASAATPAAQPAQAAPSPAPAEVA